MRVKCIKQYPEGVIYPLHLTVGKIYDAEVDTILEEYYVVKNNFGSEAVYYKNRFIDVTREEKLKRIIK